MLLSSIQLGDVHKQYKAIQFFILPAFEAFTLTFLPLHQCAIRHIILENSKDMNEEKFITVVVDLNGHMAAMVLLTERKFGLIRSRRRPLYNDQNLQSLSLDINVCANAVQYINGGLTVSMKHLTQSSIVLFEEKSQKKLLQVS